MVTVPLLNKARNPQISVSFLGLPIEVRDKALAIEDNMPKSDVNKEFYTQNIEKEVLINVFQLLLLINK